MNSRMLRLKNALPVVRRGRRYLQAVLAALLVAGLAVVVPSSVGAAGCPCSIWGDATTPGTVNASDTGSIEVGLKFRSDADGTVTGVRFYKGPLNTGTHVGKLWSRTGTLLASVTFSAETPSGWQQAFFASPVVVQAGVTYVVSYFAPNGRYSADNDFFAAQGVTSGPLQALTSGEDGGNGVYRYGSGDFPTDTFRSSNYWVDVIYTTSTLPDTTAPVVTSRSPAPEAEGVSAGTKVSFTFGEPVDPTSIGLALSRAGGAAVDGSLGYDSAAGTAAFTPTQPLAEGVRYTATVSGARDSAGNTMSTAVSWSFTTAPPPPPSGPGGPVLVIAGDGFGRYYGDILQAEGLNAYRVVDLNSLTPSLLASYDVAILGQVALNASQVSVLTNWVNGGGNLVAMRPDKALAGLMGLTDAGGTLSDGYLKVDTTAPPGAGIVADTLQFHGTADRYALSGARQVAELYTTATAPAAQPAVTLRAVGSQGGQAATFTFDLARSVVYTRQGNPAWAGRERDGTSPIRTDEMFWGAAPLDPRPEWIDPAKVAIPQADEQQRLLANLIGQMTLDRKPLPRFWYLPRGLKAAVVMTGDDHAQGGTAGRFDAYQQASPPGCSVADWECVRSTSYIYPGTPLTDQQATSYTTAGFEVGLHLNTGCRDFTAASLETDLSSQLAALAAQLTHNPAPSTNRTHCIPWSDWATQARAEAAHGIRLDTTYYYWPQQWAAANPGLFTGSGFPMRFADVDGTAIDAYQATTQVNDEAGQAFPATINTLLDRALGAQGFYSVITANMHTDNAVSAGSNAIVASAQARGVPIISARQLLTWIDGRNTSSFASLNYQSGVLTFGIQAGSGSRGLQALLPYRSATGDALNTLSRDGTPVAYTTQTIKGTTYAVFAATAGAWRAEYLPSTRTDSTVADFTAGSVGSGGYVAQEGDGELSLAPTLGAEFSGTALPAGWSSTVLATGGSATVGNGRLVVDGARANPAPTWGPGRSLEFVATFTGQRNQQVGLGVTLGSAPWAVFSTQDGGSLVAHTRNGGLLGLGLLLDESQTQLGTGFLNAPHRFRIDWTSGSVVYSIDGNVVATHQRSITSNMRPIVYEGGTGGGTVTVDWMRLSPYAASTTFLSKVFDAGASVRWMDLSWAAAAPSGTTVSFSVRTGNTPTPDASWTGFTPVSASGAPIGVQSRYLQYRAQLSTTVPAKTPTVGSVTLRYGL